MTDSTPKSGEAGSELREQIYSQHCEFHRYQDNLRWSRFQTAAVVEGALLAGLFGLERVPPLHVRIVLTIVAGLLILIITRMSLKDTADAARHLEMIKEFEQEWPLRKAASEKGEGGQVSGLRLMKQGICLLNIANVILLLLLLAEAVCSCLGVPECTHVSVL